MVRIIKVFSFTEIKEYVFAKRDREKNYMLTKLAH